MNNYEFCARWVIDQHLDKAIRVLDYGCGAGQIVNALRARDINAFGCDLFYEGGDYSDSIPSGLLDRGIIRRMDGNRIPFDSALFDVVINNQVMEHVENLDLVLAEIQRVLRPGGAVMSLFPDRGVWREGHCGIPFLHWFPKRGRIRVYYAAALRTLGLGYHKGNKDVMAWSRDFCTWLDDWTHYRTAQEIGSSYRKYFCDIAHVEEDWLQRRLGGKKALVTWLPVSIQQLIVRKLAGMVFVARGPITVLTQGPPAGRSR